MRLLEGPGHVAHLVLGIDALLERDLPEPAVDPVRRVLGPELQDRVDGLEHHLRAQLGLAHVEQLEVAGQAAGTDAHDEAAPAELVEHGGVRGHRGRVELGQVDDAGAEADLPGAVDEGGQEDQRRGDALAPRAEVLAHEGLGEAEAVGEDDGLLVFLEDGGVVARRDGGRAS